MADRGGGFFRGVVDKLLPGNQMNPNGTLSGRNTTLGLLTRLGGILGSVYGGPAAGAGVNMAGGRLINRFSPLGYTLDRQNFPVTAPGVNAPDAGQNLGFGGPQGGSGMPQGIPDFGTQGQLGQGSMFGGQDGGGWGAFAPNVDGGAPAAPTGGMGPGYGFMSGGYGGGGVGGFTGGFGMPSTTMYATRLRSK